MLKLPLLPLLIMLILTGCSTLAKPFKTGDEVSPPPGCIDYRKRGGEC